MMSFNFAAMMQDTDLYNLQKIDEQKESSFKQLEIRLRSFDRYEEVRREFNIMSPVVTSSQFTISGPAMPVQPLIV